MRRGALVAWLLLLPTLPLLSVLVQPGDLLADPLGEVPVKLWLFETFAEVGLLGGRVDQIAFPNGGLLNNPDPAGTAITALLRPLLGRAGAYNGLIWLQLLANGVAAAWLGHVLTRDDRAAAVAAVAYALTPLALVYCVAGAITDVLHLWPWPLAVGATLQALGGRPGHALLAGLAAGVGVVLCPYNGVTFAALGLPGLAWLLLCRGRPVLPDDPPLTPRALGITAGLVLLVAGGLVGVFALATADLFSSPDSQLSVENIAATRHAPPFNDLRPVGSDRYTAFLADWVAVGKGALIERELAARFYRAFSPGLLVFGLGAVALVRRRDAWRRHLLWPLCALFCILASTGPFLPLNGAIAASSPVNPAWLVMHYGLPGADLLLEPFRYAFPAVLALSALAALGAASLAPRLGRATAVLPLLVLAELILLSPTPVPLPVADADVDPVYADLSLPPGALLELPWFDGDSDRFVRRHFLHQRVHGRPIPDEVQGFPASWLVDNQWTASLLELERTTGPLAVSVTDPQRALADLAVFRESGFAGVMVTPGRYATSAQAERVRERLTGVFGPPQSLGQRWLFTVRAQAPLPPEGQPIEPRSGQDAAAPPPPGSPAAGDGAVP